jgi:antitoxin (DNA-binding transcriptional repressor) of toxin-antitoxin stability system
MRAVGIKVLKNKLSEYVRLASSGERILVTDRDLVVAELGPPTPGRATNLADARLAQGVRDGWVVPPTDKVTQPPRREPVMTLDELLAELDESRADRL